MKSEMYSKYAKQYDLVVQDNIYNAHFERPSLQALLSDVKNCNILDLGCGTGIYTEYLLSQGAKSVTCIDYSKEMIDLVTSKFGDKIKAYAHDLSLGLPDKKNNSIDVIICPLVLHYLEDLFFIFKEAHRVLKSNGYMVFSTHHPFADFEYSLSGNYFDRELVSQEWNTVGQPVQVKFYRRSLSEISDAITSSGLCITKISEGHVSEEARKISEETYSYLTKNPNFIFIKCQK